MTIFMFLGIYLTVFSVPASAYVALDFNPSLELKVDREARVMEVRSFNKDSEKLLDKLDLKDVNIYKAVKLIMERAALEGLIGEGRDNLVIASIVPVKDRNAVDEKDLQAVIGDTLKEKKATGYVSVHMSSEKEREKALNEGLSVNRYMVMKRYRELGSNISAVEINHRNIVELMESAGMSSMFEGRHYETEMKKDNDHMQNDTGMSSRENENGQQSSMSRDNGSTNGISMQGDKMNDGSMMNNDVNEPGDNKQDSSDLKGHEGGYGENMRDAGQINKHMGNGH